MVSIHAHRPPAHKLLYPESRGRQTVEQSPTPVAHLRKLLTQSILVAITVVSGVFFRLGVSPDIAFPFLVIPYFEKQKNRVVLVMVALCLPSSNLTNVVGNLEAIALALNAGFLDLYLTLNLNLRFVEEMELRMCKGIFNRNGGDIVNKRPLETSAEGEEDVMDETSSCWKYVAGDQAKVTKYLKIGKLTAAFILDKFRFSNLIQRNNITTQFTSGLHRRQTIGAISYKHSQEEGTFHSQTKTAKQDPPGDKTEPHAKNVSARIIMYVSEETIVLDEEILIPTPDGIGDDIHQNSEEFTMPNKTELQEEKSKCSKSPSRIDEERREKSKPTPTGSHGVRQRHRESGDGSTKTNSDPGEVTSAALEEQPRTTPNGRDGENQKHGDSGEKSSETNADPEEAPFTAPEEKSNHSNRRPVMDEDLIENPQTTPDGRDGENQRHGDSGENSSETNADPEDPPPSPPEEESTRSSDLFSTATNKEPSQVFEFLRFSLKRGSSRRYQGELHLNLGLKHPRRDHDFEALDLKRCIVLDYAQPTCPPLHDVVIAPFPTTGAHLLATVKARMHYEVFRLGTFAHMNVDHPCCLRLANAGFFYTFQDHMVQCYSCGLRWDDWQPEQDFYTEHKRQRPECLHVQGKDTSNVPIHEDQSRFRGGADITGENINSSSSVRDILGTSTANLQRAFQQMEAMRHKLEHSANLTLTETAASNNRNKNAAGAHNFARTTSSQGRPGESNTEEILHNNGSIITASDGEKEQSRPSERQIHDGGGPLSVAANQQHGDRFSSKRRTPLPQGETVKTYSLLVFNSDSHNSSNNNENDDNDDEDTNDSNYSIIITNSNAGGAANERQSPAMTQTFLQAPLLDGTQAQGVAERVTEQQRQEETSGNNRAQLPKCSPDTSVQARPPQNPKPWDQRYRSADGQVHPAEPALSLPNGRPENLAEPRDVQNCRRDLASNVPTTNGKQTDMIGQRLAQNSDQHQSSTSHGRHQNVPSPDLTIDAVIDIEDDTSLFAAPNGVPGSSSEMAGARTAKMPPVASNSEVTQTLCNGEAEAHALGQHATSNSGSMTETSHPEHRVETMTARSYRVQNSDQLPKSGGAIPKMTNRQQVTSSWTSDSRQRVATKPTESENDETRRNFNVRSSTSSIGKFGAGAEKIINSERREDTDDSESSRTYLNGEVDARPRRLNSAGTTNPAGTPNPNSLFATAQLMNNSVNSRPAAVVNGVSHSTSAVTSSFRLSQQNGLQDASQQEFRRRESNVQSRERPLPEIQRELPERGNRHFTVASLTSTSSTQLNASVVVTENPTQPQPSPLRRSELPNGQTTSVNEAGHAQNVGRQEGHRSPGHDSALPNGVTSGTEAGQTSGVGQHEGNQLRGQGSGLPNGETTSLSEGSRSPGQISGISNGTTTSAVEGSQGFNVRQHEEHTTSAQSTGVPNGITPADERSHRFHVPLQDHQRTSTRMSTSTSQVPVFTQAETEASRSSIRPGWTPDSSGETSGYQTLPSGHDSSFSQNTNQTTSDRPEVLVYYAAEANRPSLSSVSDRPSSQAQASPASGYDASKALYPNYRERPRRLASFVQWPHLHQDPEDLVDAGFFFAGPPDCVRCFYCGLGLKDWEAEDDPYEEHGRWRGSCAYLVFFQEEQIRTRREALRENRPVGNVFHIHANQGGQGPAAAQNNLAVSTLPARATPRGFQGEDWLSSAAAQRAREMGFLDDAIQYAIVTLLSTRAGRRAVTPQNLVQAILYIRERNESGLVANNSIGNDDGSSDDDITENFFVSDNDDDSSDNDEGEDLSAVATAAGGAGEDSARTNNNSIITYNSRMTKNELKQLEAENKELEERMRCKVCLDNKASVLFLPCRHRVCCVDCAARLRKCPMCRKNIRGSVPIAPTT